MSNFETSNDNIFGHNSNILFIFVADEVLKLDTSIAISCLQLLNIYSIFVTLEVSNEATLIFTKFLQK